MPSHHSPRRGPLVVGLEVPDGPGAVINVALDLAEQLGRDLVFVVVDASQYAETDGHGHLAAHPIDPDSWGDDEAPGTAELDGHLRDVLAGSRVNWDVRHLTGGPGLALSELAEEVDAGMIVVGARRRGVSGRVREFFNGSIAVQLVHHQHRPVLVVPTAPVSFGQQGPWE